MYKLSGNLQQNAVICVYKTSDGSLLKRSSLTAGNYELKDMESNNVFAVAVKSDGQGVVYGNVDLVRRGTEIFADAFPGTSLDTNKWTAYTEPAGTVEVANDYLLLTTGPGAAQSAAHVKAMQTINKTGIIEISCQVFMPKPEDPPDYPFTGAIVFANHEYQERHATYGHRATNWLSINHRGYTYNQRRLCINSQVGGQIQDNFGGVQFTRGARTMFIRLNCSTRNLYVNLDNGFRVGSLTLSTDTFDSLGSVLDIEISTIETGGEELQYDAIKNFSVWQES